MMEICYRYVHTNLHTPCKGVQLLATKAYVIWACHYVSLCCAFMMGKDEDAKFSVFSYFIKKWVKFACVTFHTLILNDDSNYKTATIGSVQENLGFGVWAKVLSSNIRQFKIICSLCFA